MTDNVDFSITTSPLVLARLSEIFLPGDVANRKRLLGLDPSQKFARFAHYTSADAALKIIRGKQLWMRNTRCMADLSEVQRGTEVVESFFADAPNLDRFVGALERFSRGAAQRGVDLFNKFAREIGPGTFITCLSEHSVQDDAHGRLSMWGAFGGNAPRVALVFNVPLNSLGTAALRTIFSPVSYLSPSEALEDFNVIRENVLRDGDFLAGVNTELVGRYVFASFLLKAVCLKHAVFAEEKEWRVVYVPPVFPSEIMVKQQSIETVEGVPQVIYKMPLNQKVSGAPDLDISELIDRVIIGPTSFEKPMSEAFQVALGEAGVANAEKRVFLSEIPLRKLP
jgi:hypothetical protein